MADFEFSHQAVADLETQHEKKSGPDDDERQDSDPIEQTLDVPTERSEDDAVEFVKKQYKEKSGLELDDESARGIVKKGQQAAKSAESTDQDEAAESADGDNAAESSKEDAADSAEGDESST